MAQSQRTSGKGGIDGQFGPFDLLRSVLGSLFGTSGTETDGGESEGPTQRSAGAPGETDGAVDPADTRAETADPESTPPIDFATMEPESALYALLCREGGQMKQSAMVTETEWSKSKVSRRLSNLEDAGRIGRVRQGREKVVFVKAGDAKPDAEAMVGAETPT